MQIKMKSNETKAWSRALYASLARKWMRPILRLLGQLGEKICNAVSTNADNLAVLRSHSCVRIDVVLQRRDCLEHTRADVTLVWSLFRMCLEMSGEQVALGTSIVTVTTHQMSSASRSR